MSSPKPEQHRLNFHGRELHFVAYEGIPANERRGIAAVPPTWYLMSAGKRHRVMECMIGQPVEELDRALRKWAEENAIGPGGAGDARDTPRRKAANARRDDWWSAR